jgi:hypothetical protein
MGRYFCVVCPFIGYYGFFSFGEELGVIIFDSLLFDYQIPYSIVFC